MTITFLFLFFLDLYNDSVPSVPLYLLPAASLRLFQLNIFLRSVKHIMVRPLDLRALDLVIGGSAVVQV